MGRQKPRGYLSDFIVDRRRVFVLGRTARSRPLFLPLMVMMVVMMMMVLVYGIDESQRRQSGVAVGSGRGLVVTAATVVVVIIIGQVYRTGALTVRGETLVTRGGHI